MRTTIGFFISLALASGCTPNDGVETRNASLTPYPLGQALVIGESSEGRLVSVDGNCETDVCSAVRERCGEAAYAEVVLGAEGQVLDVVCFPGNASIEEIGPGSVASASAGNNTVLVFDERDDGIDVTGDVVLSGNNAVIYGRGPAVSRIGGNVRIEKNNAVVRGVSIGGDLLIDKNNAQLSSVEISGDLTIAGNNITLAGSTVHGRVVIDGVNTVLVQNRFFSASRLAGKNLECNGNVTVSEAEAPPASDAGATDAGAPPEASDAGVETPLVCENLRGSPNGRGRP